LEKVDFFIKTLIKEFSLCWTLFYIYFYHYLDLYELEFIWTLFKIYDIDVFNFILFEFMIKYLFFNNFVNICGYPWIPADMKKIDGYSHNGCPHNGYGYEYETYIYLVDRVRETTTRTLSAPLTSLNTLYLMNTLHLKL